MERNKIMREMTAEELKSINGGFIGVLIAFGALCLAGFALGYAVGSGAAQRARE